jgi:phosphate transport system ATP-binding protein
MARKVSYYYQKVVALQEVDLQIQSNQVYALLGPARSGRTTFLRVLNRLNDMVAGTRMEGELLIDGRNIYDRDVNVTELRRKVGMVFEVPTPLPMSIFDNVAYGPRLSGINKKSILEQTVEEALTMAVLWDEVKDRLQNSAMRLSGGQQQRLCIARVLALAPEVILLDQPCSGLDPISTAKIEDSLTRLKKRFTIIIAPHNVQQAGRVADRIAFLLMGKVIEQGSVADIITNPREQETADYISGRFG